MNGNYVEQIQPRRVVADIQEKPLSVSVVAGSDSDELTFRYDVSGTSVYLGEAIAGTSTASAAWRIMIFEGSNSRIIYADGDANFDNVWDNRVSLTYS